MKKFKAMIVDASPDNGRWYVATTKNTTLQQRAKLEVIMVNLATMLGERKINRGLTSRRSYIYRVADRGSYQSATNTIYDLSNELLKSK